jgi:ParB family chromosome partitioning protein
MSERVGKKRSTIANYLRLLKLDPIIQTGIRDGFISMGHGRAIINIEDQTFKQISIKNSKQKSIRSRYRSWSRTIKILKTKAAIKAKTASYEVDESQKSIF